MDKDETYIELYNELQDVCKRVGINLCWSDNIVDRRICFYMITDPENDDCPEFGFSADAFYNDVDYAKDAYEKMIKFVKENYNDSQGNS